MKLITLHIMKSWLIALRHYDKKDLVWDYLIILKEKKIKTTNKIFLMQPDKEYLKNLI